MTTSNCIIIPLNDNLITMVDIVDSDLFFMNWKAVSRGNTYYVTFQKCYGRKIHVHFHLHRMILARVLGRELLKTELVDHIDGDGLNNLRSNIRLSTHAENMRNRKIHKNNTMGYKGVRQRKGRKTYQAVITINAKVIRLGTFGTPEEAAQAYNEAAIKYFGEFARLNIIPK